MTVVLDFKNAFMSVPLHPAEQRFRCAVAGCLRYSARLSDTRARLRVQAEVGSEAGEEGAEERWGEGLCSARAVRPGGAASQRGAPRAAGSDAFLYAGQRGCIPRRCTIAAADPG